MPQAPYLTPSPAVLPTAGSAVSITISSTPPGPPRYRRRRRSRRGTRGGEEQRKAHLGDLDAAELDAAGACHSPAPGQPSPAAEPPPPGRAWNKCQMNGLLGARVAALDGDAEAPAPAGHRPLGACRRQRLDDRLDDLLAAVVGAQRHRRARSLATRRCPAWRSARPAGRRRRSSGCRDRSGRPAPPPPPNRCWRRRS